jgi:hypothetical protein
MPGGRVIVHVAKSSPTALATSGLEIPLATGGIGRMLTAFAKVAGARGPLWLLIDSGNLRGTLIDSHVVQDSLLVLRHLSRDRGRSCARLSIAARGVSLTRTHLTNDFRRYAGTSARRPRQRLRQDIGNPGRPGRLTRLDSVSPVRGPPPIRRHGDSRAL